MNHHREGAGPPLVLIHGVGHRWQAWRPVIGRLADEFDVIACDSPGFGRSSPLPAGVAPTIYAYADAFERWFGEQGLGRPHVAGNSMGGGIALELARRGAVASVAALSPVGFWTDAERRWCQASLGFSANVPRVLRPAIRALAGTRAGRFAVLAQLFQHPSRVPVEETRSTLDDLWASPAFGDALRAFDAYDFRDGDDLDGVPVTVAWAKHDRLLLFGTQSRRARSALPHARHLTLGAGHVPTFDDPGAVAEVIRSSAAA